MIDGSLTPPLNEADILQLLNKMSFDNLIEEVSDVFGSEGSLRIGEGEGDRVAIARRNYYL